MKYFIYGYYGSGNFGDELMLEGLINKLGKNNEFIVCSNKYNIEYKNVEYYFLHKLLSNQNKTKINRFVNLLIDLFKITKEVDELYIGGGTLFNNNPSSMFVMLIISVLAKVFRKKLNIISVGSEKLSKLNKFLLSMIIYFADSIELRDSFSLSYIKKGSFIEDLAISILKKQNFTKEQNKTIIVPALFSYDNFEDKKKDYVVFIKKHNLTNIILLSSLNKGANSDLQLCEEIAKKVNCKVIKLINSNTLKELNFTGTMITERYHGAILGCFLGCEIILLGTSSKINTLGKELEINVFSRLDNIDFLSYCKPKISAILRNEIQI